MEEAFSLFGGLAGIGVLAAGIGFAYAQFKSGANKAKDDLIQTLKETATVEKEKAEGLAAEKITLVNSHQEQINELNNKLGKLQGLYEASETSKKEYLNILQGRSPEQVKFMEYVTKVASESAKYMKDSSEILQEIKTFMAIMNGELAKGNRFNKEVEEATAHDEGKVLRKKV